MHVVPSRHEGRRGLRLLPQRRPRGGRFPQPFGSRRDRDVKGKRYFDYPMKYYATDAGIRNALLNFRQIEETHLAASPNLSAAAVTGLTFAIDSSADEVILCSAVVADDEGGTVVPARMRTIPASEFGAVGRGGGSEARYGSECGGRGVGHGFSSRSRVGNRGVSSAPV